MIAVGYKIFAAILLRRLKDAGAEDRIWPTQFGFRSGCGCADALFIARRKAENACARKDGNLLLLALDWAKASDSISPAGLVNAMSRFGIPYHFCLVVRGIYNGRHFMVRDGGATSRQHPQCFGISQGCPLSPFLFSIVMTMLIQDAKAAFLSRRNPARTGEISELMYADDTLILATNNEDAEIYMQCIEQAGRIYGVQLNWNKLEALPVRCEARIKTPNGDLVVSKESLVYLGSFLCDNGSIGPELNKRLGAARAEFETLSRVWNHAVLRKSEKIRIFEACVLSRLLYCLHTAWLNKAELRRLNAFQAKCFRKILNIPHSYVSRISNKTVLERSGRQEISNILTYRQLVLFGKVAALPFTDVRRQCVFSGHTQRRGRPKNSGGPRCTNLQPTWSGVLILTRPCFQPETVENHGAILLFCTAPIECLCAMPMCH